MVTVMKMDRSTKMKRALNDRLDAQKYADDEKCQVRLLSAPRDEQAMIADCWIPERLLSRLRHLGQAYELPLLSRLPVNGEWSYPKVQCPVLEDEILFVLSTVDDPLLARVTEPVLALVRRATRDHRGHCIVVETP
jgi:hypothetical protein